MSIMQVFISVPEGALLEMHKWTKEQIISYLIYCDAAGYRFDNETLLSILTKHNLSYKKFVENLTLIGVDYDNERRLFRKEEGGEK